MDALSRSQLNRALAAAAVMASLTACGSDKAPSPVSPSGAAAATAVTVGFATSRSSSIKPLEVFQLRASATFADGATGDCTAAAAWSSANDTVVRPTAQRPGEFAAIGPGSTTITAVCGPASGALATTVVAMAGLAITPGAGRAAIFTVGERWQLSATATFSDGSTEDCTAAAVWSSSNGTVASMTSVPGFMQSLRSGTATIEATCRGMRATLPVTIGPGVRITGAEPFPTMILFSTSIRLRAMLVGGEGAIDRECTGEAVWSSSNNAIATLGNYSASLGKTFLPHEEGDVTVTAACLGSVGQLRILTGHYVLNGVVRSSSGAPVSGALVRTVLTNGSGEFTLNLTNNSMTLSFSRVGYEGLSRSVVWNNQPTMSAEFTMAPLPEVFKQGEAVLCRSGLPASDPVCVAAAAVKQDVINFTVPRDGTLRFASHWQAPGGSGIDSDLVVTLTCNGIKLPQFSRSIGVGTGGGFTVSANTGCQYALTVENATTRVVLPYQWTLNMQ